MGQRADAKAHTRARILAAARETIVERGFADTNARHIARAAQVADGTVFLHFPSMSQLAEELLDEIVAPAVQDVARDPATDIITFLVELAERLYEAYDRQPDLSRAVLSGSLLETSAGSPSDRRLNAFRGRVTDTISAAIAAGEIAPTDPDLAFLGYFSLYFGVFAHSARDGVTRDQRGPLLRALLQQFLSPPDPMPPGKRGEAASE